MFDAVVRIIRVNAQQSKSVCFPQRIRVIQTLDTGGVVRCAHGDKDLVLSFCNKRYDLDNGMVVSLTSHWSSGTLRALRRKI